MFRSSLDHLTRWKGKNTRVPLLIRGSRQVGKTWLVREHAQLYENFVEINLESHHEFIKLFRDSYGKTHDLLKAISLLSGKKIEVGKTLLFIDEIQESKEALLSLRYFKENLPQQHVIAAGSLLEFAFKDLPFPVGRIEFFHLFPMNFEEYLLATNRKDLVEAILASDSQKPFPEAVHEKLLDEVATYCLIGGMPGVLKTYLETGDLEQSQNIQQIHIASFREDFHKYASRANIEYLRMVFDATPRLLGQKFKYSNIDPGIKSRELSAALYLLEKAGLLYKAFHSSANGLPLGSQINPKKFKVFFLDVGLSHRVLGLTLSQLYLQRRELLANRGAIAEQFVAQQLLSFTPQNQSPQLYYWHRETKSAQAEIDLVTEYNSCVLPIEVKSHKSGGLKSMHLFLREKEKFVSKGLKISQQNYSKEGKIVSIPLYAMLKLQHGYRELDP